MTTTRRLNTHESKLLAMLEAARNSAVLGEHQIAGITSKLDKAFAATDLSRWMDISSTGSGFGGAFHRVKHGHDFATNFVEVSKRFGVKRALTDYPFEILKDASTKAGTPLPGVQKLENLKIITPKVGGTWGSMSMAKALPTVFAFYGTYKVYQAGELKQIKNPGSFFFITVGMATKIVGGVTTANPFLVVSGIGDGIILLRNIKQVQIAIRRICRGTAKLIKKGISLAQVGLRKVISILRAGIKAAVQVYNRAIRASKRIYRTVKAAIRNYARKVCRWFVSSFRQLGFA